MRIRAAILALALLAGPAWAQSGSPVAAEAPLPPAPMPNTRSWIGKRVRLKTFVSKVDVSPTRSHVALELNGPGKSQREPPFVAFVRSEALLTVTGQSTVRASTEWLQGLLGKFVCVEGDVTAYKGQPRITVMRRKQLQVLD